MKLLLDTCVFLWWSQGSARIPREVRKLVADPANDVYVSAVTAWELAVKHGLGKLELPAQPDVFVPTRREWYGFESLPVDEASALQLPRLPPVHGDPFDRLLICQAIEHGMTLVTPDRLVSQYPVRIAW